MSEQTPTASGDPGRFHERSTVSGHSPQERGPTPAVTRIAGRVSSKDRRQLRLSILATLLVAPLLSGCSIRTYAINMVGDALASGDSVYESDEDIELVGNALPFALKLTESLLAESPNHEGLLLTSCRGFVLYSYAYVNYPAEVAVDEDFYRARTMRERAGRLYHRALGYCLRGLEQFYPGFGDRLETDPDGAALMIRASEGERELPFVYWTAASLGLAISASRDSAAMLARIPEVEALLERALEIDETWDDGAFHEFKVQFAGAVPGQTDYDAIRRHYDQALELSEGKRAGLHVAYAEAVSVPTQNGTEFREMIERALAVDPEVDPDNRLLNLLAHRRGSWLLDRIDDLILELEPE